MTSPPDAIFELWTPVALPQDQISEFTAAFRSAVLPPDSQLKTPAPAQAGVLPWPVGQVLIVGVWLSDDGSDGDRTAILQQSGFLPQGNSGDSDPAGLFLSAGLIQFQASYNWPIQKAQIEKGNGSLHFTDSITATLSPAGIRTVVSGSYDLPVLPDVGFTVTFNESLALTTPPGQDVAMTSTPTAQPNVDATDDLLLDSVIVSLFDIPLGVAGFIAGEHFASDAAAGQTGVGSQVAAQWPAFDLIKELTGKIRFGWDHLTVDDTGVRTTGRWWLDNRLPTVAIVGPTFFTYPISHPDVNVSGTYSLRTTDLVMNDSAQIHWTGAQSQNAGPTAVAKFRKAGDFSITASVTDQDGFSATGSIGVSVTATTQSGQGGSGGNDRPPLQPP